MTFLKDLKEYYSKHPVIIILGAPIATISLIVTLWSFSNMLLDAYKAYITFTVGNQILTMSVIIITINIFLISLITAYLSYKMKDLMKKK